jgi:hypothetical protein
MTKTDFVFHSSLDKYTFDPAYEHVAKAFGFDPYQPLKLLPKAGDPYSCPKRSAEVFPAEKNGVRLEGKVWDSMEVEMMFFLDLGPVKSLYLGPTSVSVTFREIFPDTVMNVCKDKKIRDFLGLPEVDPSLLSHEICDYEVNEQTTLIKALPVKFRRIV